MIDCLLFLTSRGDIIFSRAFRDGVVIRNLGEIFRTQVVAPKLADRTPCRSLDNIQFLHLRHDNVFLVATARINVDAAMVFCLLARIIQIFQAYFGEVNEDSLKENFVVVQELIDEVIDFGYPQVTEVDILKEYIRSGEANQPALSIAQSQQITIKATGKINWRKDNVRHKKNEVFLDIIEDVNLLMSPTSQLLSKDVTGNVVMRSFLSGMPECKLGLNDKMTSDKGAKTGKTSDIDLEDVTFHQCVRLGKFDADRTISFVPPDGQFTLMKYRTTDTVAPPFKILAPCVRELGKTRIEIDFRLRADFSMKLSGSNVVVTVPVPSNSSSCKINVGTGKAKFDGSKNAIIWKIKRVPGGSEYRMGAEVQLLATTNEAQRWSRPPISLQFQVPMLAASGLNVRFLKVNEPKLNYAIDFFSPIPEMSSSNQASNSELLRRGEAFRTNFQALQQHHTALQSAHSVLQQKYQTTVKALQSTISELQAENAQLREDTASMHTYAAAAAQVTPLNSRIASLERDLASATADAARCRSSLDELKLRAEHAISLSEAKLSEVTAAARDEASIAAQRISVLESHLQEYQSRSSEQQAAAANAALARSSAEAESRLRVAQGELQNLRSELQRCRTAALSDVSTARNDLADKERDRLEAVSAAKRAEAESAAATSALLRAQEQSTAADRRRSEIEAQRAELAEELRLANASVARLQQSLATESGRATEAVSRCRADAASELALAHKASKAAELQVSLLNEELREVSDQHAAEISRLEGEVSSATATVSAARATAAAEIASVRNECAISLRSARHEADTARADLEALRLKCSSLEATCRADAAKVQRLQQAERDLAQERDEIASRAAAATQKADLFSARLESAADLAVEGSRLRAEVAAAKKEVSTYAAQTAAALSERDAAIQAAERGAENLKAASVAALREMQNQLKHLRTQHNSRLVKLTSKLLHSRRQNAMLSVAAASNERAQIMCRSHPSQGTFKYFSPDPEVSNYLDLSATGGAGTGYRGSMLDSFNDDLTTAVAN